MSTTSRRVPRRIALRYVLVALALLIVLANVLGERSAAVDAPDAAPRDGTALAVLAGLEVKGPGPDTGYARSEFGSAWVDVDDNGCDTRNDVLARDLTDLTFSTRGEPCEVRTGTFHDPYTGETIAFRRGNATSAAVQIDHVVPLLDAWRKGARAWDEATRTRFANDPLNLLASDGPSNQAKGARDASAWLPPNHAFRCPYVARQIAVKAEYGLSVTPSEAEAMERVLADCPAEPVPAG
ncbi:HNH endonuclease family protein [Cellulosimicrobium sp. Marseille-Q8652]